MKNKEDNPTACPLDVITAMRDRISVRAFLPKKVSKEIISDVLTAARWAPSGVNTQPWQVVVLNAGQREQIAKEIIAHRENQTPENPDYHYYPQEWFEPYKSRRKACGMALYGALNIQIEEKEKRKAQWYRNYSFFDAPVALIFHLHSHLEKGSWMDMGMFLQNVMLAARFYGLETCPQAALAEYPDIIRKHLALAPERHIVCGMAMGYADWSHPVNQYRTARAALSDFVIWND